MNIDSWTIKKEPIENTIREEYSKQELIKEFEQIKDEAYRNLHDLTITLGNLERILQELKGKQLYIPTY